MVRVYNPLAEQVQLVLRLGLPFETATLVNLREHPQPTAAADPAAAFTAPDHFQMTLAAKRIQTIWFH